MQQRRAIVAGCAFLLGRLAQAGKELAAIV
jgi:hypothetical protein